MARLSEMEKFQRFVEKHEVENVDGYWWCGGSSWDSRDYRAVLCAVVETKRSGRQVRAVELCGETPRKLATEMRKGGFRAPPAKEIAEMCERARCSPRPPRRTRGRAHAD